MIDIKKLRTPALRLRLPFTASAIGSKHLLHPSVIQIAYVDSICYCNGLIFCNHASFTLASDL